MASLKVRNFFNGRFFEIPKYQRGYAWDKRNVRDLFDDIFESGETLSSHYIGTFVLSKHPFGEDHFYVVDGQQRITTIALIINEAIKYLSEPDAAFYRRFYIAEKDDSGEKELFRLRTLGKDNDYFSSLLRDQICEPQNKSQRLLQEAYEEIQTTVTRISDRQGFLRSIENLEIMEFIEQSEGDAIRIFQTVNDRGKPLSNMEKAKSLLIYFSNRYLEKRLDDEINNLFGEIFEIYDDVKQIGETQNINLIKGSDFDEDNIMRYHFVSYCNENYDATAQYVLRYLKNSLSKLRNEGRGNNDFDDMENFINDYTGGLYDFFYSLREILKRTLEREKYCKIFTILGPSATLYPLLVKLEMLGKLDTGLPKKALRDYTFLDLLEIIDVRIYKTRGTDPRAEISRFTTELDETWSDERLLDWLLWYNQRWMPKEEFLTKLNGHIYGNRALAHMLVDYCEFSEAARYTMPKLRKIIDEDPTIEHILSQTPKFSFESAGFRNNEQFLEYQDTLGNLTILERRLNSAAQNKVPIDKVRIYDDSLFKMSRVSSSSIDERGGFGKSDIEERKKEIADYLVERWWC